MYISEKAKKLRIDTTKNIRKFFEETGMTESDVLVQIEEQRDRSKDFLNSKRLEFESDLRLYNNQKTQVDKIGDTTLFNTHTSLIARSYIDKPESKFAPTQLGAEESVNILNKVMEDDFAQDDIEKLKYQKEWDKFFYGVGIIAKTGWDGVYKRNNFMNVDPMTWVPDPDGDYLLGNYAYTGFDRMMYKFDMYNSGYLNVDQVADFTDRQGADEAEEERQRQYGLQTQQETQEEYNPSYEIYTHFALFNGTRARVTTANDVTLILEIEILQAGSPEEKENPEIIKPPFAFYYWKPRKSDPFGYRVADLVRDVQVEKARIANLRIKKAMAELYPMYMFNKDFVNSKDLSFDFNKFIPVSTGLAGPQVPLGNIIQPMRLDFRADNSYVIDQSLDRQIEKSTSIGEVAQGTTPESRETATTSQLIQTNTDINLSLNTKINKWGEKQFLRLWVKGYYENFTDGDKKFISANTGIGDIPLIVGRKDFLTEVRLKIIIESTGDIDRKRNKERLAYNNTLPLILQSNAPKVSKDFSLRRVLRANGVPEEEIDVEVPPTPQELIQEQENTLLLQGEIVDISPEDDDLTHLVVLKGAGDSLEAELHKQAHIQQYIMKGGNIENLPQEGGGMMNSLAAQASSQIAAENVQEQAGQTTSF